jgi:indole-3-acetate monooxygenase
MGTLSDPLRAAQALRATIRATRQETEEARRLAPQVVEGLMDASLCRLALPASLGGHEVELVVALQVYEELAWADASVAWIAWNNQLVCLASRFASDAVRTELFSDARRLFANSTRPSGRAVVVEGGFRVSGRWSLVSGCELADWIPVMCVITEGTEPRMLAAGVPEMRMTYLPKGAYRILDTWYVGGLRGTGSHDIVVDDVFVPAERTFFSRTPLSSIGPCLGCRFLPPCVRGAPRSVWALRKRQPTPCSSWERQRSRSIRFLGCGIGRQSR